MPDKPDQEFIRRSIFCLQDGHIFSPLGSHLRDDSPACGYVRTHDGHRYLVGTRRTVTYELETGSPANPPCRWTRSRFQAQDWLWEDFCTAWCRMVEQVMSRP